MKMAERVYQLRDKLDLTQRKLAENAGLTQATISRIEGDELRELRADSLVRLARALRVTVDYLVGNSDSQTPHDIVRADPGAELLLNTYAKLTDENRYLLTKSALALEAMQRDTGSIRDLEEVDKP